MTGKEIIINNIKNIIIKLGVGGAVAAASILLIPDKFVLKNEDVENPPSKATLRARKVMVGCILSSLLFLPASIKSALSEYNIYKKAQSKVNRYATAAAILFKIPYIVTTFTAILKTALYYKEHREFPATMEDIIDTNVALYSSSFAIASNDVKTAIIEALLRS